MAIRSDDLTPTIAPPDPNPKKPRITLPPLSCDSHFHVFGPHSKFPYAPNRPFTPTDASKEDLFRLHEFLGIQRGVFVNSTAHGSDNRVLVDLLAATSPERVFQDYGLTFLWMGFVVLVARPLAHWTHDLLTQQALAPGMTNLVRWQTHRFVLRQSITFFANDFAGHIASNIMQTGVSLRESVVQIIDAVWIVTVFSVSSLVIFAQTDWHLACPLALWLLAYVAILRHFVPQIRDRSALVSELRSGLTGRIVDSYTNIQTVKLFAHPEREDDYARAALVEHTAAVQRETRLITLMNGTVSVLNSVLIVGTSSLAVWL